MWLFMLLICDNFFMIEYIFLVGVVDVFVCGLVVMELDVVLVLFLLIYLVLFDCWNCIYNLIVICDLLEMVICYLFDLLVMQLYLECGILVDLGIGFGLFGILLVIVCLQLQVILVESNGKKVCFMCEVVCQFGLGNVCVVELCVEVLVEFGVYDVLIVCVMDILVGIIDVGGYLLCFGGWLLVMKGVYLYDEIVQLLVGWMVEQVLLLYVLGLIGEWYLVVVVGF